MHHKLRLHLGLIILIIYLTSPFFVCLFFHLAKTSSTCKCHNDERLDYRTWRLLSLKISFLGKFCTLQTPFCTHVWSVRSFFWQGYIFCNHFCIWQVFYFLTTNVQTKTTYFYSASFHLYSSHGWSANSDIKLCLKIWNYLDLCVKIRALISGGSIFL